MNSIIIPYRANSIFTGVLNGITQGIKRTQSDISAWRGDQQGANLILDDSEYLYRDILEGTQVVSRTQVVSVWDSTSMLSPANTLNSALDSMMDTLIGKKRQVDKINYTPIVRSQLLKIRDSTDALTKMLFTKLPSAAALVARPVSSLITSKIDKGITAFPLPSTGSQSWWPFGQGSQPAPTVSGPSPYRNDPVPQGPPPQANNSPPPQGNNGWGQPQPQQNGGYGAPPQQNAGWGRKSN